MSNVVLDCRYFTWNLRILAFCLLLVGRLHCSWVMYVTYNPILEVNVSNRTVSETISSVYLNILCLIK